MSKIYNKLVRDRIPEIIEASHKSCLTATLSDRAYLHMLDQKLNEELAEYQESKAIEELADLIEVIAAVAKTRGCSWDKLMQIRDKKRHQRGGFEKRVLLLKVSDIPSAGKDAARPKNSGKPWTPELDQRLCEMLEHGATVKELCEHFGRSHSSIAARLVRLGKITERSNFC